MSPHTARHQFIFIILYLVCLFGREGYSIKSLEIARYWRRKKDECKGGERDEREGIKNQQLVTEIENMEPYITPFNEWPLAVRKEELAQNLAWQKMKMVTQPSFQTGPMCGILDSKSWKSSGVCNEKFLKKERSMRMDTEPLPTNQARPLMYVPIIKKYIHANISLAVWRVLGV